jgi:DnaJ-domain-containing protein 1
MFDTSEKRPMVKVAVEIELDGGRRLTGSLYLKPQGRLSDMLNDERTFLPFEAADGQFMMLKKTAFTAVTPLSEGAATYEGNNPFQILGVREGAPLEEIKAAYHRLCAENHPDRLNGAGLGPDHVERATARMARINDAWTRVQKQYESAGTAPAA